MQASTDSGEEKSDMCCEIDIFFKNIKNTSEITFENGHIMEDCLYLQTKRNILCKFFLT
jgi:hypothetical protein